MTLYVPAPGVYDSFVSSVWSAWARSRGLPRGYGDQFESEVAYTQFTVLGLVFGMMLLEHIVACCWFGISPAGSGGWLDVNELQDKNFMEQYTSALSQKPVCWKYAVANKTLQAK